MIGNELQIAELRQRHLDKTLPQTMIFLGAEGIGKFKVACELARRLLCLTPENINCSCESCHLDKEHPDFHIVNKEVDAKNIKVDQVREIIDAVKFAPYFKDGVRVIIIRDAHELGRSAANSLLKILEEPPAATYFIMTTHAYAKMLPTILSRAQKFYFSPLKADEVAAVLEQVDPNLKYPKTWLSMGSPGLILKWLANGDLLAHPMWRQFFGSAYLPDFASVMDFCQKFKNCEDVEAFFEWYLFNLRVQLIKNPDIDRMLLVDKTTAVMRNFAININPSLAMEHLLL